MPSNKPQKPNSLVTVILVIVGALVAIGVISSLVEDSGPYIFIVIAGAAGFLFWRSRAHKDGEETKSGQSYSFSFLPRVTVEKTSEFLSKVEELNNNQQYNYYLSVEKTYGKDVRCESRAAFNNLNLYNCFLEWVNDNYENVPDLIMKVSHNRAVTKIYETDIAGLRNSFTKGWDGTMKMSYEKYREIESELVDEKKRRFPQAFEIEITKNYVSSAGNVDLSESKRYDLADLKQAYETIKTYRKPLEEMEESARVHRQLQKFYGVNLTVPPREQILKVLSNTEGDEFLKGYSKAVESFFLHAFDCIKWPVSFEKDIEIGFVEDSRTLFVDFLLPGKNCIPTLKEIKNLKFDGSCERKTYSDSMINEAYDSFVYQLVLIIIECRGISLDLLIYQ